jgi:hypothetical protein
MDLLGSFPTRHRCFQGALVLAPSELLPAFLWVRGGGGGGQCLLSYDRIRPFASFRDRDTYAPFAS